MISLLVIRDRITTRVVIRIILLMNSPVIRESLVVRKIILMNRKILHRIITRLIISYLLVITFLAIINRALQ